MTIAINFEKGFAEEVLDALKTGKSISAPPEGWTGNHFLRLAGACFFAAMSQGPSSFWPRDMPDELHPEHLEATEQIFLSDLHAGIEFMGRLSMLVADGNFDSEFDENVRAVMHSDGVDRHGLIPVRGFKAYPSVGNRS